MVVWQQCDPLLIKDRRWLK